MAEFEVTVNEDIGDQEVECPLCKGLGNWDRSILDDPKSTVPNWITCPLCSGKRKITVYVGEVEFDTTVDIEPREWYGPPDELPASRILVGGAIIALVILGLRAFLYYKYGK